MRRLAVLGIVVAWLALLPLHSATADQTGVVTATVTVAGDVSVEVVTPERKVLTGNPFQVEARVVAGGSFDGTVVLKAPATLLVRGDAAVEVRLRPGKVTVVRWSACSEVAGQHVVMAAFESDGTRAESAAQVIEIAGKKRATCPKPWK